MWSLTPGGVLTNAAFGKRLGAGLERVVSGELLKPAACDNAGKLELHNGK